MAITHKEASVFHSLFREKQQEWNRRLYERQRRRAFFVRQDAKLSCVLGRVEYLGRAVGAILNHLGVQA